MEEDWIEAVRREGFATGLSTDRATSSTAQPTYWRRQRTEDNFIMSNQDVTPTTDMETKIKVEELLSAEETRNYLPYKKIKSRCGQTNWNICR
eukprot:6632192-Heterocapsa_arctica.AAC.1